MSALNLESLLDDARARTGLDDFGRDDFMEPLRILVDDINLHARIRADCIVPLRERFARLLSNRLWFAHDLQQHPEILQEKIVAPVEIASLPRTGSTKLQRLLAASGDFQYLTMWQTHMFARIPGLPDGGEARRIAEVREYEKWMISASPDIRSTHPMFTDEAEEDQWLTECTFRRAMTAMMFDVPLFAQWLATQDPRIAYGFLLQQLQYLQWQNRQLRGDAEAAKPWLLKSPDNFGCEMFLREVFPDLRLIITHRHPLDCVPSASTMVGVFRRLYGDMQDRPIPVEPVLQAVLAWTGGHMQWRAQDTQASVLDLAFKQITHDGIGAARRVYDFLGLSMSTDAERRIREWDANNARDKHGKNVYSLDATGLSEPQINQAFGDYIARYRDYF